MQSTSDTVQRQRRRWLNRSGGGGGGTHRGLWAWPMPSLLALRWQVDLCEVKTRMVYIASARPFWTSECLKNKTNEQSENPAAACYTRRYSMAPIIASFMGLSNRELVC